MSAVSNPLAVSLRPYCWAFLVGLAAYAGWNLEYRTPELLAGGLALSVASMLPVYLWCRVPLPGLPLLPVYAATFLQLGAMPLLTAHSGVMKYPPAVQLEASLTATGYLLVATAVWFRVLKRPQRGGGVVRVFAGPQPRDLLTGVLAAVTAFNLLLQSDSGLIPNLGEYYTLVIHAANAAATVCFFVLWYEFGKNRLTWMRRVILVILTLTYLAWAATGLLLASMLGVAFSCSVAYTVSRARIPFLALAAFGSLLAFLHPGKYDMRAKYWGQSLTFSDYPGFFADWAEFSLTRMKAGEIGEPKKATSSAAERGSSIHMLMLVQSKTPERVPYLSGETYLHVPEMLIPRVLHASKPEARYAMTRLAIRYGLQNEQSAKPTTIGFSLESEAYANFGYPGIAGLAAFVGWAVGVLTRWPARPGYLSLGQATALTAVGVLCTSSGSLGSYVSTSSQAVIALWCIGLPLTKVESAGTV